MNTSGVCKTQNAKQFLKGIKKLDNMIENKLAERDKWRELALSTTAKLSEDKVQTSGNKQKMAVAVENYIDIEAEVDRIIDRLVAEKQNVISVIEQLNAVEYDILHKIYVQGANFYDIASKYGRTYSWATTMHGRALKHVQNILDKQNSEKV